jgi:hypothetical protein
MVNVSTFVTGVQNSQDRTSKKEGYPGAVSLELTPWPLGVPDPGVILRRMREALCFMREGFGG